MCLEQSIAPPVMNRCCVDPQLVGDLLLGEQPGVPQARISALEAILASDLGDHSFRERPTRP
jgi:hypothetical protein